jgi:hypothetical protein
MGPELRRYLITVLGSILMVGLGPYPQAAAASEPASLVAQYIRLVSVGESEQAKALWSPSYLAASARLGIDYRDEPYAFDLASPLHTLRTEIEAGRCRVRVGSPVIGDNVVAVPIQMQGGPAPPPFFYAVVREGERWWLAGRIWATGSRWVRYESEFFTVFCQDEKRFSRAACDDLDRFVAEVAAKLEVSPARLTQLRTEKILYYLCDDETIANLTGYQTKGMADLASSAVISSHFPHFHEVSHLLVNYALAQVALYPLPILQEGIACRLGGRWGRAPRVVLHTGWVNATMEMGSVGEILTRDGFLSAAGGPDVAYSYAAVLCDLIVDRIGWRGLLGLQEDLAGTLAETSALTATSIAATITRLCFGVANGGVADLESEFVAWLPRFRRGGVVPGAYLAGADSSPVQIRRQPDGPVFSVRSPAESVLILTPKIQTEDEFVVDAFSDKFAEVLPGRPYDGQLFGIRCSSESISVYDFRSNRLSGIWVAGFTGEYGAVGDGPDRIRFKLSPGMIPDTLLVETRWEIVQP